MTSRRPAASSVPAWIRTDLLPHALAPDPGLANLRVAARAAVTQPLVFAFGLLVLGNPQLTLFAAFAVFGLLVLGNFGGRARSRLAAYSLTALVGAALVAVGSLASPSPWTAALTALVVVLCIEFARVFSGYVAGARTPLLMAVVLAASVPAPVRAVPAEVAGWLLGGAVATAAALLLWPRYEADVLRDAASAALRALARLVGAARADPAAPGDRQRTADAVKKLRAVYRQTTFRPGGPTRRDRAMAHLVTELERAWYIATDPTVEPAAAAHPCLAEGDELAAAVVSVLEASAGVLQGGPVPDLSALDRARAAHRRALDAWAGDRLRAGASPRSVLDGLDRDHRLRVLAYVAVAIGVDAAIIAGRDVDVESIRIPYGTPVEAGPRPFLRRIGQTVATHLSWTSPALHTSVRAAVGLALAVLVARLLGLGHAFWVVLGTMSVLRSNALATGRSTLEALAGTLLGFALGGLFMLLFATQPVVLGAALPVAVFLAAYAPTALSFVAGQAAFTILLLIFFNLLTPVGWRVGLVRIQDVAVGSAIGVVAGTVLWPRGARADFAHTLSRQYRLVAVHLSEALELVLGRGRVEAVEASRRQVVLARERTAESFDQLLGEHGSRQPPPEVGAAMVAAADHALTVTDSFRVQVEMGYDAGACGAGARRLDSAAAALVASWFMLAERIEGVGAARAVPLHREELRQAALDCLAAWRGEDWRRGSAAIAVAWTREWLEQLDTLVRDLQEPAAGVAAGAAAPWWR